MNKPTNDGEPWRKHTRRLQIELRSINFNSSVEGFKTKKTIDRRSSSMPENPSNVSWTRSGVKVPTMRIKDPMSRTTCPFVSGFIQVNELFIQTWIIFLLPAPFRVPRIPAVDSGITTTAVRTMRTTIMIRPAGVTGTMSIANACILTPKVPERGAENFLTTITDSGHCNHNQIPKEIMKILSIEHPMLRALQ